MGRTARKADSLRATRAPSRIARVGLLDGVLRGLVSFYGERPKVCGRENVEGLKEAVILAVNHSSHMDTPAVLLALPRRMRRRTVVAAAADYFFRRRSAAVLVAAFVGAVPMERKTPTRESLGQIGGLLSTGWNVLMFPEGTRTPDGRLYRGKTGIARVALATGAPVVPVGLVGTFDAFPSGTRLPRRAPVEVRFGRPLSFEDRAGRHPDQFAYRSVTDEIMYEIMMLTGQEYADEYSSSASHRAKRAARQAAERQAAAGTSPVEQPQASQDSPARRSDGV